MMHIPKTLRLLVARTPILMFLFFLAILQNWKVAVVLVGAIVTHELWHLLATRLLCLGPFKVTFRLFSAVIHTRRQVYSHTEASVLALAGPAGGLVQAAVLLGLYRVWPNPWLLAVATGVAVLGILHGLPIIISDGGQVWEALLSRLGSPLRPVLFAAPVAIVVGASIAFRLWLVLPLMVLLLAFTMSRDRPTTASTHATPAPTVPLAPLSPRRIAVLGVAYALTLGGLVLTILGIVATPGYSLQVLH